MVFIPKNGARCALSDVSPPLPLAWLEAGRRLTAAGFASLEAGRRLTSAGFASGVCGFSFCHLFDFAGIFALVVPLALPLTTLLVSLLQRTS